VNNETDNTLGRFVDIRHVAQFICEKSELDLFFVINALCWLALEQQASAPAKPCVLNNRKGRNPKNNFLSAAAYFNLIPLVLKLLAEGCQPICHDWLFPPAMELAARAGHTELLEIFQKQLPEFHKTEAAGWKWEWDWYGKVCPDTIVGAAIRGDLAILKLALYPPSSAAPSNADIPSQPCQKIDPSSQIERVLRTAAQSQTRSVELYDYVESLFEKQTAKEDLVYMLILHSGFGNLSMVRCILDRGIPVNAAANYKTALIAACQGCHENIVDLLLQRGADPNIGAEKSVWITALPVAASSGSLTIVRKLILCGARVNEAVDFWSGYRRPAIWWAVAVEHVAMFQLLLENDATLDGYIGSTALEMALELGMISMAEILQKPRS
jgi:hypothetical protein